MMMIDVFGIPCCEETGLNHKVAHKFGTTGTKGVESSLCHQINTVETGRCSHIPRDQTLCPSGMIQTEEPVIWFCPFSDYIWSQFSAVSFTNINDFFIELYDIIKWHIYCMCHLIMLMLLTCVICVNLLVLLCSCPLHFISVAKILALLLVHLFPMS